MIERPKLKPCPTGHEDGNIMEQNGKYFPYCSECDWCVDNMFETPEEAAAAWNTRVNVKELTNSDKRPKYAIGLAWYTGLAAGGFAGTVAFGATGVYSLAIASLYCFLVGVALFALNMHGLVKEKVEKIK